MSWILWASVESHRKVRGRPIGVVSGDETSLLCTTKRQVRWFRSKSQLAEVGDKLSSGIGTVRAGLICTLNVKTYVKTTTTAIVSKSINTYHKYLNNRLITQIGVCFHPPP